ncbi:MAG: DUF2892 domain-containing protein [Nitrospira sp.]|nr:DUF2892 domain-containing protein [Nitrospira sp.]
MALAHNVGGVDRTVRIVLGLLFLSIGLFGNLGTVGETISFVLAAAGLITGFLNYCPLNALLGINTCNTRK